jgi:hypothetical protein
LGVSVASSRRSSQAIGAMSDIKLTSMKTP